MSFDRLGRPNRARNQTKKTPRDKVYLEIVRKLNEQGLQGEEKNTRMLIDCQELGILFICWGYGGWQKEWFNKATFNLKKGYIVKDLTELVDEKTLRQILPKKK